MTTSIENTWIMAQRPTCTVPRVTQQDVGLLCEYWIRDPNLFLQARPELSPIHFSPFSQFAAVFEALCLAHQQFGRWDCAVLTRYIEEVAPRYPILGTAIPLDRLTLRSEGGFVFDAIVRGPLTQIERQNAEQLQQRFLIEKTVFQPLLNFMNPVRHGEGSRPESMREFLELTLQQNRRISSQSRAAINSLVQRWHSHEQQLEVFRGRSMIGLETGMRALDLRLLGLRGVTLLGAAPGMGKTVLCMQLALGVCRHHAANDAVAVFISLELSTDALLTRVKSHLTQTDWHVYTRGFEQPDGQCLFTPELVNTRDEAFARSTTEGFGNRLFVVDRTHLTQHTADNIVAIVEEAKRQAQASRALVVLDYLQLLELPDDRATKSDLDADKARFRIVQEVCERTRTEQNPLGDAVIAISEARKPVGDSRKNQEWGTALADLMGSSRLGYGADAGLLLQKMTKDDLDRHYGSSGDQPEVRLERMRQSGYSPLILRIAKGRDGMMLGEIPLQFEFRRSTMTVIESRHQTARPVMPSRSRRTSCEPTPEVSQ